jgi:hypothetical protein
VSSQAVLNGKQKEANSGKKEQRIMCYKFNILKILMKHAVTQLVESMRYKPEGRGFDSRRCH